MILASVFDYCFLTLFIMVIIGLVTIICNHIKNRVSSNIALVGCAVGMGGILSQAMNLEDPVLVAIIPCFELIIMTIVIQVLKSISIKKQTAKTNCSVVIQDYFTTKMTVGLVFVLMTVIMNVMNINSTDYLSSLSNMINEAEIVGMNLSQYVTNIVIPAYENKYNAAYMLTASLNIIMNMISINWITKAWTDMKQSSKLYFGIILTLISAEYCRLYNFDFIVDCTWITIATMVSMCWWWFTYEYKKRRVVE